MSDWQVENPPHDEGEKVTQLRPHAPILILFLLFAIGCSRRPEGEVVLCSTVDKDFAAPILSSFARSVENEIQPRPHFNSRPNWSSDIGPLVAEIEQHGCDVFWNSGILHTLRLQKLGLLEPHDWQVPAGWPAVAADKTWCGFAARARVLIVNVELLPEADQRPTSVMELADDKWKDRCAIARPSTGTAATHAAVLYQQLGAERAEAFFKDVAGNAAILSSDQHVAEAVARGDYAWGLTNSDAAVAERDDRMPVAIIFPDQQPSQWGTLRIPTTVAILNTAPHPVAARALADFLVSPETEKRLAMGNSSQIPLFREVDYTPHVLPPEGARWMEADFEAAAEDWETVEALVERIFASR